MQVEEPQIVRWLRWRTFANVRAAAYGFAVAEESGPQVVGALLRSIRGKRAREPLAEAAGISESRWRQIEGGDSAPADTLWRMAKALNASAAQVEEIFEKALLQEMFLDLARIGASRRPELPRSAELGVSSDPTLTPEAREKILDYIALIRRAELT